MFLICTVFSASLPMCYFSASTSQIDRLLLSIVAIPVDPLLHFSTVRKPGDVEISYHAGKKMFLDCQPCRSAPYTTSFSYPPNSCSDKSSQHGTGSNMGSKFLQLSVQIQWLLAIAPFNDSMGLYP